MRIDVRAGATCQQHGQNNESLAIQSETMQEEERDGSVNKRKKVSNEA